MKKILIVEDDVNINNLLKEALSQKGYTCGQAFSGTEAALWLEKESWMLVLLDLMLPGMTGEEVLQLIRRQGDTPVIVLTAKDAMEEKLDLLTSGADDYITKPFDINEVIARVQIQLRHAGQEAEPDRIECGGITLDDKTHQIWVDGQEILHLTRQEYAILELLIRHPKQVFRKEAIFTYAWEEEYMGETKTLDVHISNIRKKLKAVTDKEYIQTVWGIGYRLNQ
ncbi:response regulator receiver domain protein [Roseburia sp. CAG:380]|jgi:DNA-binding response OmpR family regulator|uniref:response regulator transcription factor n=1 Tax=Roseburia sp. AM59-24XD TaxID=2293138 RepID=UPI00033A695D|nr:response regulator transcription factor [Roseburia sp. AM59-24XD]RHP88694.1 DNA-binding response regulator [Roseburia sp. AM59-24XD]CDC93290.1 response regulator receiver domain protein [Roseburia sp. CAG:380]HCS14989.1 DNA-binding response regulator [Lachnospiraceae bacterium]